MEVLMDRLSDYTEMPAELHSAVKPTSETPPRQYPAIVHAAVFTALIVPITLLPYLVAQRQISRLRRTVTALETQVVSLQSDLHLMHTKAHKVVMEQDVARNASERSMKADILRLLDDSQHSRNHAATLKALGVSLGDVAAFMQEVELDFGMDSSPGKDRRGIEKLRLLAFHMQSFKSQSEKTKATAQTDDSKM
ncbi:hypothetical protein CPB83DRAFT_221332 [Crepidotus variabilis]|uniref:Uncharacterized protein n=1 Tax=Crepidotus variabilis TaxID=179855 RepID=A0A9P6EUG6_9AGAR|nr:hypothetical protein CPB83DRAFT_221332 [Crepidotus variabilis]